jgi:hypothetical protein
MTDLIVVPQAAHWQRLKRLVLDSVSSPITRRVYNLGLDEFFAWYEREPRPGFTKATVAAWRVALNSDQDKCPNCGGTGRCPTCSDTRIITLGIADD